MRLRPFSGTKRVTSIACIAAARSVGASQRPSSAGLIAPPSFSQRFSRGVLGSICVITRSIGTNHRSEETTSELQSLMRISYAVFCLTKKKEFKNIHIHLQTQ